MTIFLYIAKSFYRTKTPLKQAAACNSLAKCNFCTDAPLTGTRKLYSDLCLYGFHEMICCILASLFSKIPLASLNFSYPRRMILIDKKAFTDYHWKDVYNWGTSAATTDKNLMQVEEQTQNLEALDCRLFLAPCMPFTHAWTPLVGTRFWAASTRLQDHLPPWTTTHVICPKSGSVTEDTRLDWVYIWVSFEFCSSAG